MNTLRQVRRENKQLQREIYLSILNSNYSQEDKVKLQQNFTKNYYEVIKLGFDISVTKEILNKYSREIKNINNPKNLLRISKVVENENTYILINRYLKDYLHLI